MDENVTAPVHPLVASVTVRPVGLAAVDSGGPDAPDFRLASVHRLGAWAAWVTVVLSALYVPTLVLGFIALGNFSDPLKDPFLAIAEVLIILMAPVLVALTAAIYLAAAPGRKIFGLVAFGSMLLAAATTLTVHFVELTVARRIGDGSLSGPMFGWRWPSVLYGVDVVAWDVFFGVSLLCAAAVFPGRAYRGLRVGLLIAGALSVIGLVGPISDQFGLRTIGIFGYAVVFPIACIGLARVFSAASRTGERATLTSVVVARGGDCRGG
jgi:hypothetical protein